MNSRIVAVLALVCLAVAGCGGSGADSADDPASPAASSSPATAESTPAEVPAEGAACEGRYADYSAAAVAEECYTDTILFFHAPWCPECRGFEEAIKSGEIPEKAQILKVDYDSATGLRKKYEVTIQSTFVRVDASGERLKLWSGYGQDKSVDAILENTQ
ncbi:thioredoxin family protein [Nocardioides sp. KC13]|uniref:Thioredoxin family protein n=1 Tax=Nocardioides turkmenicus TaxID=2711220 RepID=A0A6M1R117_9ACTN|nr:thioredoxin family protein [Nocardioides sp. KC13]NGN95973.1 thioredoxin family protein [Nocardioides sp. KC13]